MFFTLKKIFEKMGVIDKWLGLFVILGSLVVVISLFRGIWASSELKVLQTNTINTVNETKKIFVDIEGAVVNPGVYELNFGDRIKDVLVKSGGFASNADRNYVAKTVNLAEQLKDGQKVYIPFASGTPEVLGYAEAKNGQRMVNVNTASKSELDTLWGIGEARADSIVKSRPYASLEEMVTKKVITQQILERNKEIMSVY
jgi:competence protein ComEA